MQLKLSIFLCVFVWQTTFSAQNLQQRIDGMIQKDLPNAILGIQVQDADTHKILYQRNAQKLLYPASNIKLFTAAAAFLKLGGDYQFKTTLSQKGKHFYLKFTGSPSLKITELEDLILTLKEAGVESIQGNIYLDTSRVLPPYYPSGVSYDDLGWYYNAPSSAIILDENMVVYEAISPKRIGGPVTIKPKTALAPLKIKNELNSVDYKKAKHHCDLNVEVLEKNTLRLYGCLAQHKAPKTLQFAIPDPGLLAEQVIIQALKANQIEMRGQIRYGKTPKLAKTIATHQSEKMEKLIAHMLEESDNLYADSITKLLGFVLTGQGNFIQGIYAMQRIFKRHHIEFDKKQLELADGSGTRYNLASAQQIVYLLDAMYHHKKIRRPYIDALPKMGISGTLKYRMRETALKNRVFAKTGTMHDISSLSGYIKTVNGKNISFSMIINGISGNLRKARALQDKILLEIVATVSPQSLKKHQA